MARKKSTASKQQYRGNPAEKLYEFLTDFSGGINQKLEDSLIGDNQARNVSNFDITAGGLLTKRKGFVPLNLLGMIKDRLHLTSQQISKMVVNRTFDFYNGDENVLCLLTADSKIINVILSGNNIRDITFRELGTQNASVEIFGTKPILVYSKRDGTDRTMQLDIWIHDNWESAQTVAKASSQDAKIDNKYDVADDLVNAISLLDSAIGNPDKNDVPDYIYMFDKLTTQIKYGVSSYFLSVENYGITREKGDFYNDTQRYSIKFADNQALWPRIKKTGSLYDGTVDSRLPYAKDTMYFTLGQLLKIENGFTYDFDIESMKLTFSIDVRAVIESTRLFGASQVAFERDVALRANFEIDGTDWKDYKAGDATAGQTVKSLIQRLVKQDLYVRVDFDYYYDASDANPESPIGKIPYQPDTVEASAYIVDRHSLDTYSNYQLNREDALTVPDSKTIDGTNFAIKKGQQTEDKAGVTYEGTSGQDFWGGFTNGTGIAGIYSEDPYIPQMLVRKHEFKLDYSFVKMPQIDSIDSNHITKYIPDAFSMQNLSYNLLTLKKNDDPFKFKTADASRVYVDKISEVPTLDGVIQLNGYYAQVGVKANYKVSLNLPSSDTRADYSFGWRVIPIEQWNKIQQSPENNGEYIKQVIAPSFLPDADGNVKTSEFSFTPQSASQYVASIFSFKIDTAIYEAKDAQGKPDATINGDPYKWLDSYVDEQNKNAQPIRIDFILSTTSNIEVSESFGMNQSPKEVVENFHKTKKSISWNNQMFLYGGSNTFYVSDVNNYSYFPMLNNFQIPTDSEIVSMVIYYEAVIIATDREQFVLTGNSPTSFKINELNNDIGVVAEKSVKNNDNFTFQLTANGVYKVKTLFNFRDRYNVEKVDEAIASSIPADEDATAVVWNNKYYICIPSEKTIWIYYNDYQAWIKYESPLFELSDMLVIEDELYLITKYGMNILKFSNLPINEHGEGGFTDYDMYVADDDVQGISQTVDSIYKSKQIDFGLPNHDKKFKKLHTRFADTPGKNELFVTVWVDSKPWVVPETTEVVFDPADVKVKKEKTEVPAIETVALTIHDLPDSQFSGSINNIGNKYDNDQDQLHEIIVAGRGRQIQFQIEHRQNKQLNIKNFANILKVKKPKAIRTTSKKA